MLIKFNRDGSPIPCPCNGCVAPKRQDGCHTFCDEYIQYQKDLKVYNKNKRIADEKRFITDSHKKWLQKKQKEQKRRY